MPSKILMISTNRERSPQPVMPIGAAWVAEALHQAGFEVRFLDLCFGKDPLKAVMADVEGFRPDGIAISIRNLDNCDSGGPLSYLPEIKQLTDRIKAMTDAPILLGGSGVSIMPLQVLDFLGVDHAVVGAGEVAAVQFFTDPDQAIPGLVSRGSTVESARPQPSQQPNHHRWINYRSYLAYEPVIPIQGKRGCTNRCLYCTYSRIEGNEWLIRDPAQVVAEILETVKTTGCREFEFVDSVFNQPEGYLEKLLDEVNRADLKVRLHVASLSPAGLTAGQVRLMERSGVVSAVMTAESADDEALAGLEKGFGEEAVYRAATLLAGSPIKILWCFLVGGPGENRGTLASTIRFINSRIGGGARAFITSGIRIYPGTGLHRLALDEGLIHPLDHLLFPTFYFSPAFSPDLVAQNLACGLSHPERCLSVGDTRQRLVSRLRRISVALNLPTPLWQYSGMLKRFL